MPLTLLRLRIVHLGFLVLVFCGTVSTFCQTAPSPKTSAPDSRTSTDEYFIPVKLQLMRDVSSANAKVGEAVAMEVVEPVEINGQVAIAAGASAKAFVSSVRHRGHNRREGRVVITVSGVTFANGEQRPVRQAMLQMGAGHGEPIFGPCTFPIPADPAGLFRKGADVVIPKGYIITAALPKDRV